jgi:predicted 2-oxoglutarate/Fe(II)-dependent dioxygenase YbiX
MTPVHAFAHTPEAFTWRTQTNLQPSRHDVDLDGLLGFVIDQVVTDEEADAIVQATEVRGYRDEAPGIATPPGMRMNKTVHWLADDALLNPLMQRMAALLPSHVDGMALHGRLSHRINMYRYDDNDVFNRHIDGDWPGYSLDVSRQHLVEWPGVRSALTMILYLNDPLSGVQGGNTRLLSKKGQWVDVVPRTGSALFFRHGFTPDSVVHIGDRVHGHVPKYVARINVMYELNSHSEKSQ